VQLKAGGRFRPKLNTGERPIVNKYREGKMKRTLKREVRVPEIVEEEVMLVCKCVSVASSSARGLLGCVFVCVVVVAISKVQAFLQHSITHHAARNVPSCAGELSRVVCARAWSVAAVSRKGRAVLVYCWRVRECSGIPAPPHYASTYVRNPPLPPSSKHEPPSINPS
jgi:hypothetical protein